MQIHRRRYLGIMGAVVAVASAFPATVRTQAANIVQREELDMEITRAGSQPSTKGPADWFTGTVRIDPLFQPKEPARTAAASVTFEPGTRIRSGKH
jgi:hypothetical protein